MVLSNNSPLNDHVTFSQVGFELSLYLERLPVSLTQMLHELSWWIMVACIHCFWLCPSMVGMPGLWISLHPWDCMSLNYLLVCPSPDPVTL